MIKVREISHKYLDVWLLFKSQEMEQHGASRPCVKLAETELSMKSGTDPETALIELLLTSLG